MSGITDTAADTVDLADIARSLVRGWRWILGGVAAGAAVGLLVLLFAPRRFDGSATAIIRATPEAGGSMLAKLGEAGAGGGAAALLGGGITPPIETDIQILSSRSVVGAVVDSLHLQVEVRSPALPSDLVVRATRFAPSFKDLQVSVDRVAPGQYRYSSGGESGSVTADGKIVLPIGTLVLQSALPEQLRLRVFDRDEEIQRISKNLSVAKAGGEVVRVGFRARDSLSAAAVPNAVLVDYLARRKTDDRGVNAHRAEFLAQQLDSTSALQRNAEEALRRFQEQSGLVDAQVIGRLELESAADLRKNLGALEVEGGALEQLLAQVKTGQLTPRQLIAYPSFLKSPGINDLLRQLAELETDRTKLLERRLESDQQVMALSQSIANIEGQLMPLAASYASALRKQRASLQSQLGQITTRLTSLPGSAESSTRLTREVLRLNQLSLALQTQLVQARLSAISEGGDVRALDRATPPRKVAFPEPWLTMGLGVAVGLVFGLAAALFASAHGRYLEGTGAIERLLGVPAVLFTPGVPLLMSGREALRTLLIVSIDDDTITEPVAARLAGTARARGDLVTVLDGSDGSAAQSINALIDSAEEASSLVLVRLPGFASEVTAAVLNSSRPVLLVAREGRVNRRALVGAAETLKRLNVPCAGVVLVDSPRRASLVA